MMRMSIRWTIKERGLSFYCTFVKRWKQPGVVREEEGKKIVRIRKYTVKEAIETVNMNPDDNRNDSL